MSKRVREYSNDTVKISYDPIRCIHVAECVRRLPRVFDPEKRPWIDPGQASADAIAQMIPACPTGALHYERLDGGKGEAMVTEPTIALAVDGPLYVTGVAKLSRPDGEVVLEDLRSALCRCVADRAVGNRL